MEELFAILSGYGTNISTTGRSSRDSHSASSSSSLAAIPKEIRNSITPAEQSLLKQALPLGHACSRLRDFVIEVESGRSTSCWLRYSLSNVAGRLLKLYHKKLTAPGNVQRIADVQSLVLEFGEVFPVLAEAAEKESFEDMLRVLQDLLLYVDCPPYIKQDIGRTLTLSWLHLVAQWVANASLPPDGTGSFFIIPNPSSQASPPAHGGGGAPPAPNSGSLVVSSMYLPFGVSKELAAEILLAGEERKMWLLQAQEEMQRQKAEQKKIGSTGGGFRGGGTSDYFPTANTIYPRNGASTGDKERDLKAAMEQSELKRRIIFDSIYSPELCRDGILLMDELERVIAHAKSVWASALWEWTKNSAIQEGGLRSTIGLVRETFLGSKGDLWKTFVENCFAVILPSDPGRIPGRVEREVPDAFRKALHTVNLRDSPQYEHLRLVVLPRENPGVPLDYSLRNIGKTVMNTIARIQLNASLAKSTDLILFPQIGGVSGVEGHETVGDYNLDQYDKLFTLHLSLQFAMHSLLECRLLLREITFRTGIRVDIIETNFQRMMEKLEAEDIASGSGGGGQVAFEERVDEALQAAVQQQPTGTAGGQTTGGEFHDNRDLDEAVEGDQQQGQQQQQQISASTTTGGGAMKDSQVSPPNDGKEPSSPPIVVTATANNNNKRRVKPCTSLQDAQRAHRDFLHQILTGSFSAASSSKDSSSGSSSRYGRSSQHDVKDAIEASMRCIFTLYGLLSSYKVQQEIEEQSMSRETQDILKDLIRCVEMEVFPSLIRHLAVSTNGAHRALWIRLDFNQWLSKQKTR